jgi:SnoaL-like protein
VSASENLEVHTRCTEAENRHDLSHHDDFLHDDIVMHVAGAEPTVGIEAYCATVQAGYDGVSDFEVVSRTSSRRMTASSAAGGAPERTTASSTAFRQREDPSTTGA